jgi:hypothetical protein
MLDLTRIKAITLDLDDTLWPIWPTIERAEKLLQTWLQAHAPQTAVLFASPHARRELRDATVAQWPLLAHDLSAMRRESIRLALQRAGEDPALAEPAFDVFFAARMEVTLFDVRGPRWSGYRSATRSWRCPTVLPMSTPSVSASFLWAVSVPTTSASANPMCVFLKPRRTAWACRLRRYCMSGTTPIWTSSVR